MQRGSTWRTPPHPLPGTGFPFPDLLHELQGEVVQRAQPLSLALLAFTCQSYFHAYKQYRKRTSSLLKLAIELDDPELFQRLEEQFGSPEDMTEEKMLRHALKFGCDQTITHFSSRVSVRVWLEGDLRRRYGARSAAILRSLQSPKAKPSTARALAQAFASLDQAMSPSFVCTIFEHFARARLASEFPFLSSLFDPPLLDYYEKMTLFFACLDSGSFKTLQQTELFFNLKFEQSLWMDGAFKLNALDEDDSLALLDQAVSHQVNLGDHLIRSALQAKLTRVLDSLLQHGAALPEKGLVFLNFLDESHTEIFERYLAHPRVVAQGPMTEREEYTIISLAGLEFVSRHGGRPIFVETMEVPRRDVLLYYIEAGRSFSERFLTDYAIRNDDRDLLVQARVEPNRRDLSEIIVRGAFKILNRFFPQLRLAPEEVEEVIQAAMDHYGFDSKKRLWVLLKWLHAHDCPPSQAMIDKIVSQMRASESR